jgi:myo-inositol-1-phosphate synthase
MHTYTQTHLPTHTPSLSLSVGVGAYTKYVSDIKTIMIRNNANAFNDMPKELHLT